MTTEGNEQFTKRSSFQALNRVRFPDEGETIYANSANLKSTTQKVEEQQNTTFLMNSVSYLDQSVAKDSLINQRNSLSTNPISVRERYGKYIISDNGLDAVKNTTAREHYEEEFFEAPEAFLSSVPSAHVDRRRNYGGLRSLSPVSNDYTTQYVPNYHTFHRHRTSFPTESRFYDHHENNLFHGTEGSAASEREAEFQTYCDQFYSPQNHLPKNIGRVFSASTNSNTMYRNMKTGQSRSRSISPNSVRVSEGYGVGDTLRNSLSGQSFTSLRGRKRSISPWNLVIRSSLSPYRKTYSRKDFEEKEINYISLHHSQIDTTPTRALFPSDHDDRVPLTTSNDQQPIISQSSEFWRTKLTQRTLTSVLSSPLLQKI